MKNVLLIIIILLGCNSQKGQHLEKECKIEETKDLTQINNLYERIKIPDLYKDTLENNENDYQYEVILYKMSDNQNNKIVVVRKINNKIVNFKEDLLSKQNFNLKEKDLKTLNENLNALEGNFYFETCNEPSTNNDLYLLVINKSGKIFAKYLAYQKLSFKKSQTNNNVNKIKRILEIMYRNSW
ncbi:hypothetical protein ACKW6Q_19140 [Chryseobacterium kwangjuense]|uniref:Gliding motility lipoprotein GldD n=1 Tax=Chryseobacterium kwangjuense TaxID=267125 RepID=A0ABW9K6Z7_9FLAO